MAQHDTRESVSLVLPPVIPYGREFQALIANEAEGGHCTYHVEFGKDYILTRDRIRLAQKELTRR
jgi:hypothetical protein